MRAFALVPLLAVPVFADYASDLVGNLTSLGLTTLAKTLGQVAGTDDGKALVALLSNTSNNFTVFAPNDQGFSGAHPNATATNSSDPGLFNTLKYHVVSGHLGDYVSNYPNTTIGRTFLNASNLVELEGNKSQVVAWATRDNKTQVLNQNTPVTVLNATKFENLQVLVIDAVLDVPRDLPATFEFNNLSALNSLASSIGGGAFAKQLASQRGFTLFAPSTSILSSASVQEAVKGLNETTIGALLGNHLVNGTTLYSSTLENGTVSASGEQLNFIANATGKYVQSGNSSFVQVSVPDIIVKNGVIHIIDGVLLNTNSNPGAASSAFQSATSAAGTAPASTETAPLGNPSTQTQTGAGASNTSGGDGKNAAVSLGFSKVALAVSVLGAIAGGVLTLA